MAENATNVPETHMNPHHHHTHTLFSTPATPPQAVWFIKTRALTLQNWIDDTEVEEEGIAEMVMDENAMAAMPRPGTSVNRPNMASQSGMPDQSVRPVSASGRPLTGFARPGTNGGRPGTGSDDIGQAFKGNRPGTSRPMTTMGRQVRQVVCVGGGEGGERGGVQSGRQGARVC